VTLLSRNDTDYTKAFADVAADVGRLQPRTLLLDGEAVAFDPKRLLSIAARRLRGVRLPLRRRQGPRDEPLTARRAALEEAIDGAERIFADGRACRVPRGTAPRVRRGGAKTGA
jgi:ATP-dependent DNA ligase